MAVSSLAARRQGSPPSAPNAKFQYPNLYPLPVPSPRRQRCISCSDSILEISTPNGDQVRFHHCRCQLRHQHCHEQKVMDVDDILPDVIVTRRTRTDSLCGRINDDIDTGTVKYFCRSRGHGFIIPDNVRKTTRVKVKYMIH